MTSIHPWVNFNGNAEEAFTFYKSVFGGEFTSLRRFKDVASDEFQVSDVDAEKIMRISLSISDSAMLIGNDVPEFMGTVNENENRSKIYVGADSKEEVERMFNALSVGGHVEVPVNEAEGVCSAMFRDKYGIEWIIEYSENK